MITNQLNTIFPCPFSKGYGIPVDQAWSSLKIFFVYRLVISSLFVVLFYSHVGPSVLGKHNPLLYTYSSQGYCFFSILSGVFIFSRLINYTSQAQIVIFTDIIFITLLMHSSGGINSGIGILLVVSIAAGGLLIGGRCALLFAALASLSILAEQIVAIQLYSAVKTSFTYAGMLGASFFTVAYLSYVLAKRAEQSETLAFQHQQTITNLEELNQYIIQHLQSGIIISNIDQQIKMCNEATLKIINCTDIVNQPLFLSEISTELSESFQQWINNSSQNIALIRLSDNSDIHIRFSLLETHKDTFYMIILEDISLYNQRLQQSKLASLGRLTASIAHEIRNPLGAISHASQLLNEAPQLSSEEKRLAEIIQSHCQRVNKIIEDILQLSRRQPSKREKINLIEWLQSYLENFIRDTVCDPNSIEIDARVADVLIYMDAGQLKQILDNLCSNALKYGLGKEAKIIIQVDTVDNTPYLNVYDNGAKIDVDSAKHLFEPFFTTSPNGTGLGLYISKELAELNQAKLSYAVIDDENCFTLRLSSTDSSIIEI